MQVMAYRENGDTSNIERVFLYKDSGATAGTEGDPYTGLTNASTGLNISTIANNEATANTDTSAATSSIETITTLGTYATPTAGFVRFKEVDATNMPGLYELQWEDARYAVSNAIWLDVTISGVADLAPFHGRIYTNPIPANTTEWLGTACAAPSVAGVPEVDLTHVAGATTNVSALATNVDAILTDTGTTLDGKLNTAQADLDIITGTAGVIIDDSTANDTTISDAVWDEDATGHQTQGTFGQAIGDPVADTTTIYQAVATDAAGDNVSIDVAAVKAETALIVADTNELQGDWANAGRLDAILDTIAADVVNVDGIVPAAAGDSMALTAAAVDAVWDEPLSGHNTGGTTGKALKSAGGVILHSGTADAGAATTIDLETGVANTTDDYYNHTVVIIIAGTGAGQERIITDYVGSTQQATVTPAWVVNPDATSEYELVPGTVHAETQGGGYAGGAVWIGPSGSTGTQLYVDGTVDNPIDDGQMANAKTVADALNLRIFRVEPTSSITLGETLNGYSIEGIEYTLNLGSQDVSNTYISGATIAASTATGSGTIYNNCIFDNAVTLSPCVIRNSYLGDTTITAGSAGNFFINHCVSRAAGNAVAPNFDFGALLNASNLNIRDWSGGIELENMGAGTGTYNCSIEGNGSVTINANCSATSNIAIRGNFTVTDNAGLGASVVQDAAYNATNVNAEVDTAISDAALATAAALTTVDTVVDAIKVVTDALGSTAAANLALSAGTMIPFTVTGTPTSTEVAATGLTATTTGDDTIIGRTIIMTSGGAQYEAARITDYVDATGVMTVTAMAGTVVATDTGIIV